MLDQNARFNFESETKRQIELCRLEVLIFLNDLSLPDVVESVLAAGDAELCKTAAGLLFQHRQKDEVFPLAEKAFLKIIKDANLKTDVLATIDAYQNLIRLHIER